MRHLATVRKILDIAPIPGADSIVVATVDGWKVVVKKDEFEVGDLCVYFEIDSFLPCVPRFEILRRNSLKKMGDIEGYRLKTIKLRGQVSQGFVIPIDHDVEVEWSHTFMNFQDARSLEVGDDLTEMFGVLKYEAPVPVAIAGQVRGNFPSFIKKTDQERCQNLIHEIFTENVDAEYEVTMKMDGTSFTGYFNRGIDGVCGRNWELKMDNENAFNALVLMFVESGLRDALREFGGNYAVQGELMGPGIQKNREGLKSHKLFVFDIYDIDNGCYLPPAKRRETLNLLYVHGLNKNMVEHVPVFYENIKLLDIRPKTHRSLDTVDALLEYADGPSLHHAIREGLVFKRKDGQFSFKAISNRYLLKEED